MSRRRGYAAVADLDDDVDHLEVVLQLPLCLSDVPRIPYSMDKTLSGDGNGGGVGGLWSSGGILGTSPGFKDPLDHGLHSWRWVNVRTTTAA